MIYTQEPWEIQNGSTGPYIIAKEGNENHVAIAQLFPRGVAGCETKGNASLAKAAPKMYGLLRQITLIEPKSMLADCAYQGPPPKKWIKEIAPYYEGFNKALEQICQMIRPYLAEVEGKEEE